MALLYLIRHGEPEIRGVMLGQMDPPLSIQGRLDVAAAFEGLAVETVWSSPLLRARETAALIRCQRVAEIAELREVDQGEWTGKTWAEVEAEWPDLAAQKLEDWLGASAPRGEDWNTVLERVRCAWNVVKAGPNPTAIVGHQGVNSALLYLIAGRDPLQFQQAYGEVIRVEYD